MKAGGFQCSYEVVQPIRETHQFQSCPTGLLVYSRHFKSKVAEKMWRECTDIQ